MSSLTSLASSLYSTAASWGYWATTPVRAVYNRFAPRESTPADIALASKITASAPAPTPAPAKPPEAPEIDSIDLLRRLGENIEQYKKPEKKVKVPITTEMTDRELDTLSKKASMYATVSLMDSTISESLLLDIVNTASKSNKSLLEVFREKNGAKLGIMARLTYFFVHYLRIVPNTVESTMKKVLSEMRSELVQKKGGENLSKLSSLILNHAESFLADYRLALEEYANGAGSGTRDQYLETRLAKPIEQIVRSFSATTVEKFILPINYFKSWENSDNVGLKLLAFLCRPIGWIGNQIMGLILKSVIPSQLTSFLKKSGEQMEGKNVSFAISITQGLLEQLLDFKDALDDTTTPLELPNKTQNIVNQDDLRKTVHSLLEALKLDDGQTREEIRNAMKPGYNPFKSGIEQNLEQSAIDGCSKFFAYFSNPGNSEEFFHKMFNLCNTTFEGKQPTTPEEYATDRKKLQNLVAQMNTEAESVFKTVIRQSLRERYQGPPEVQMDQLMEAISADQQAKADQTLFALSKEGREIEKKLTATFPIESSQGLQLLQASCRTLQKKAPQLQVPLALLIADLTALQSKRALTLPDAQKLQRTFQSLNSLLIAELTTLPKAIANDVRKAHAELTARFAALRLPSEPVSVEEELQNMILEVGRYQTEATADMTAFQTYGKEYRKGISAALNPLYLSFQTFVKKGEEAKEAQKTLLVHQALTEPLRLIDEQLRQQEPLLKTRPETLTKEWAFYRNTLNRLRQIRDDGNAALLDAKLTELETTHLALLNENQILKGLRSLGESKGLLSELGRAVQERASNIPSAFRWADSKAKINLILRSIPEPDRTALETKIKALRDCLDPNAIETHWEALKKEVLAAFSKHTRLKNESQTLFLRQFRSTQTQTKHILSTVDQSIAASEKTLHARAAEMAHLIEEMRTASQKIAIRKIEGTDTKILSSLGGTATIATGLGGALLGYGLSSFLGPIAGPLAAGALSGAVYALSKKQPKDAPPNHPIASYTAAGAAAGAALSFVPYVGPLAAPALLATAGAHNGKEIKNSGMNFMSDQFVFPHVDRLFKRSYKFMLQKHVWQRAFIDTMENVDKAYT